MKDMNSIGLKSCFEQLGITKGTKLFISSGIVRLRDNIRKEEPDFHPKKIIDILKDIVTDSGTLVFPTYNWDFCQGKTFDIKKTKGKTGALGQIALDLSEFQRTSHPIYSFAVWGTDTEELMDLNNKKSFGKDSPFAYFHDKNFRKLIIDVSYKDSVTFIHYVEACEKVGYRYEKDFTAEYIDINNISSIQTYSMYVRDLELNVEIPNAVEKFFEDNILYKKIVVDDIYMKTIDFGKAYDVMQNDIINNNCRNIASYLGQM